MSSITSFIVVVFSVLLPSLCAWNYAEYVQY